MLKITTNKKSGTAKSFSAIEINSLHVSDDVTDDE